MAATCGTAPESTASRRIASMALPSMVAGLMSTPHKCRWPSLTTHATAEEDLSFCQLAAAHGAELGVAVALAIGQLVLIHQEDGVLADGHQLNDLLGPQAAGGREAAVQELGLADVVVLRAGEHVVVGQQHLGGSVVLG